MLDSLVEWALPLSRREGQRRRAERQAANAGRTDVDVNGRRVDDREFEETRDVLTMLGTSAIGWRRNQGRYPADLIGGIYTQNDFTKRGLPDPSGVRMETTPDGTAWFWRRTISGWVLGYAVSEGERGMLEWFYSREQPPEGPPGEEAPGWSDAFVRQGDWA